MSEIEQKDQEFKRKLLEIETKYADVLRDKNMLLGSSVAYLLATGGPHKYEFNSKLPEYIKQEILVELNRFFT